MPHYGFAIDLPKCIGCHACTIACKAEHEIPVGVNRCWVKTVEKGTFPDTRRFFFPVLCNQCDEAPCARICPTNALFKRRDGIVDLNGAACIGCRACMVACPYDQLFIDPGTHTAEKCNFCANRVENQLLPACVSVCPTECRIFGDLEDASSELYRIVHGISVTTRKPEKGTIPHVYYIGAEQSAIQPEIATRPFYYKEGTVALRPLGSPMPDPAEPGAPRVDYDTPHAKPWGFHMALYLLTKGVATGALFLSVLLWLWGSRDTLTTIVGPGVALLNIVLTAAILVHDLERPERFLYILTRPNWRSWMAWGAYFLTAFGGVTTAWLLAGWFGIEIGLRILAAPALGLAVLAQIYTGFLFAQGLARDLWQGPHATLDLVAQSAAEGAGALLVAALVVPGSGLSADVVHVLTWTLFGGVAVHLGFMVIENLLTPSATLHHDLAVRAIRQGAFARTFWVGAMACGGVVPLIATVLAGFAGLLDVPVVAASIAIVAIAGGFAWEYVWVEAGQSVPLS
jgi:Fe-S-cluster-containing dehydrogenase component/formate-dependent nitrite reductase membrane component NrfD